MSKPTKDKIYRNYVSESCREGHDEDCISCAVLYLCDIHDEMLEALKKYAGDFESLGADVEDIKALITKAEGSAGDE